MDDTQLMQTLDAFLGQCKTASLATVDEAGLPHAANVQFAHVMHIVGEELEKTRPGLALFYVSSPSSAHSRHIVQRPDIAMTIYPEVDEPSQIHGLQIHGLCDAITWDALHEQAWEAYAGKYPFVASNEMYRQRVEQEQFYCVRLGWLRWIDNRREFGFKVERQFG